MTLREPDPVVTLAAEDELHPDWLHAAWPELSPADHAALRGCARIADRLTSLIAQRLGWEQGEETTDPLAALAARPATALARLGVAAGAIWHARSIRLLLDARDVEALVAQIGAPARALALANPTLGVAPPQQQPAEDLAAAAREAGSICLAAWLAYLPAGSRGKAAPKLPRAVVDRMVLPEEQTAALRIMTHLAAVPAHVGL